MTFVMGECIVPSIRRENDQCCNGGLKALKALHMMKCAVPPIAPSYNTLSVDPSKGVFVGQGKVPAGD